MRSARFLLVVALLAGLPLVAPTAAGAVTLTARGSLNQVQVWGADPGATLDLHDGSDATVATGTADAQGAYVFGVTPEATDDVPAGNDYTVHQGPDVSNAVDVFTYDYDAPTPPPQSFYDDQVLPVPANYGVISPTNSAGYGYITTRDGTTLAANFMAPIVAIRNGQNNPTGPWPVIVDYSGYEPANPANGGNDPEITLLRAAGFAVVGVNMRGTGCSGGVYSYFERLQGLDGYDVIESIATQPWVDVAPTTPQFGPGGPMVGMAGISFPGISQLFVGRTNPPSLAAMSPLSVIADSYRSILYPGGILNDGFATEWAPAREDSARPAGQAWAQHRIDVDHDQECDDNQRLKLQAPPLVSRFAPDLAFAPDPGDDLAPVTFVDDIDVPTFIAGAFQDEQTGGHWSTLLDEYNPAALKRAILYNGTHADALGLDVLRDLLEFLDIYVARRSPQQNNALRGSAPAELDGTFGAPYAIAPRTAVFTHAGYENPSVQPKVVLRWERGARDSAVCQVVRTPPPVGQAPDVQPCDPDTEGDGALFGRFESGYAAWPPPRTAAAWFLEPDAALGDTAPTVPDVSARGSSAYAYTPDRSQETSYTGSSTAIWDKDATYHWTSPSEPTSLRYVTAPFTGTRAFAGSGSVDLWIRAAAADTDIEVTLSEVRPGDGQEIYIQSGWLRASHRSELPTSTALDVQRSYTAADEADLPAGEFVRARVELFPFAHIVRPGSRLVLTISGPGGNRPFWRFAALPAPTDPTVEVGHSVGHPSQLTLPEVAVPAGAAASSVPVCGDLRSQPCRAPQVSTRPTAVTAAIDPGDTATDLDRGVDVDWTAPEATGVTGNDVVGVPTGEEFADEDGDPGHRISIPVGSPPSTATAFAVDAAFGGGPGQRSDASPDVVADHPFTDVARTAWNVDAVDWVSAWHLAEGFTDGTFRNGATVTRSQFVSWLWTMFGRPSGSDPHPYVDVPSAAVSDALSWAVAEQVVTTPGNHFFPRRPINRAQIAFWLWAAAGRPDDSPGAGFVDVAEDAWYGPAVDWAKDQEVVVGYPGNQYRPMANATRGQAANMFLATATSLDAAA